jgi:hypothetical protein
MPIISGVDYSRREINIVFVGPVTLVDVLAHAEQEKVGGALGFSRFVDMRGAALEWSPGDALEIAERVHNLARETHIGPAVFLASSSEAFEMISTIEKLTKGSAELRVFRDEDEARAWLAAKTPAHGASSTPSGRDPGLSRS